LFIVSHPAAQFLGLFRMQSVLDNALTILHRPTNDIINTSSIRDGTSRSWRSVRVRYNSSRQPSR
jgi:hypothetical protein